MKCTTCNADIPDKSVLKAAASIIGRRKSEAKARASRENGKLGGVKGGRPRKIVASPPETPD